jgi:hypothetical protein
MAYFFAVGKPAPPVDFDDENKKARFLLRDKNNRFYVVTTSLEQFNTMRSNPEAKFLIVGTLFSFRMGNERDWRIGFRPMILEPLNGDNRDLFHRVAVQLIESGIEDEEIHKNLLTNSNRA